PYPEALGAGVAVNIGIDTHSNDYVENLKLAVLYGQAREALLRTFPEVELVVGKAGRAETPTDPAPPDMVETVINLLPHDWWPKRELAYDDALAQTAVVLAEMERRGWIKVPGEQERTGLVNDATMHAVGKFDQIMRSHALQQIIAFRRDLGTQLVHAAVSYAVAYLKKKEHLSQDPPQDVIDAMVVGLAAEQGDRLAAGPDLVTITQLAQQIVARLVDHKLVAPQADLLVLRRTALGEIAANVQELLGQKRATYFTQLHDRLQREYDEAWTDRVRTLNWELVDMAGPAFTWQAAEHLQSEARSKGFWKTADPSPGDLQAARRDAEQPFAADLLLWRKAKDGLIKEMDTVVQMPGWGNIWTQPIINRVDMLATGVRTMLG
ncbi:MAG TPA: hypothetical protein PKC18_07240, partial [Lacipirellulaceae bacterium]|nr:hypothetical protein [Lacipirellulaceae bacterium]